MPEPPRFSVCFPTTQGVFLVEVRQRFRFQSKVSVRGQLSLEPGVRQIIEAAMSDGLAFVRNTHTQFPHLAQCADQNLKTTISQLWPADRLTLNGESLFMPVAASILVHALQRGLAPRENYQRLIFATGTKLATATECTKKLQCIAAYLDATYVDADFLDCDRKPRPATFYLPNSSHLAEPAPANVQLVRFSSLEGIASSVVTGLLSDSDVDWPSLDGYRAAELAAVVKGDLTRVVVLQHGEFLPHEPFKALQQLLLERLDRKDNGGNGSSAPGRQRRVGVRPMLATLGVVVVALAVWALLPLVRGSPARPAAAPPGVAAAGLSAKSGNDKSSPERPTPQPSTDSSGMKPGAAPMVGVPASSTASRRRQRTVKPGQRRLPSVMAGP